MLSATEYSRITLRDAFDATAKYRGSYEKIQDYLPIIENIRIDQSMNQRWKNYQKQMQYANDITFSDAMDAVQKLMEMN